MSEVVWKKLGEVCSFKKGTMITSKTAVEGDIPVISGGQKPAFYHNEANRNGDSIVIAGSGAYAGYVSYWTIPVFVSDAFSITPINEKFLQKKYLYYYLLHVQDSIYATKTSGGIPHVYSRFIENFILPVPDLIIQKQIVNHLDTFTSLISRLESELELRQKQYEHYREELLSFEGDKEVEWKTLGDIGDVAMCKRIFKEQTQPQGEIPFYKIGTFGKTADAFISRELYEDFRSKYKYPKIGDILMSASGSIGRTVVYDGSDAYYQDSNIVWIENDESIVSNKFLRLIYSITKWNVDNGGVIARLYNKNIRSTIIPIPRKNRQQQIVDKLDMFEQLIAALKREIALRKKQYAYYRDKLLTFE